MKNILKSNNIAVILFFLCGNYLYAENISAYHVGKTEQPPVLDGNISDPCWEKAPPASGFVKFPGKDKADPQTVFKVLYDDKNLYLAIKCEEPASGKLLKNQKSHDSAVYSDDCIEIFIGKGDDDYLHLIFNPAETQYEASGSQGIQEDFPWSVKTNIGKNCWQAEVEIPFTSIHKSLKSNDMLRINIGRERHAGKQLIVSSWTCCETSFHEPKSFGYFLFGDIKKWLYENAVQSLSNETERFSQNLATVKISDQKIIDNNKEAVRLVEAANRTNEKMDINEFIESYGKMNELHEKLKMFNDNLEIDIFINKGLVYNEDRDKGENKSDEKL